MLSLDQNELQGNLHPTIGWKLPYLQVIQLSNNQFTGLLPLSLSNCSELVRLQLDSNFFEEKIALDFGGQKSITYIILDGNNFGSGEPDEMNFISSLSNCSNLLELSLSGNKLRGTIPTSVGNLSTELTFLNFEGNQLYGRLPSAIGNLLNLDTFGLDGNQFAGTIPFSIGNLGKLQVVTFSNNKFSGAIPQSIGNLTLLIKLYMNMNRLEGIIPISLPNCTKLLFLVLSRNNFSGVIPKQLFSLSTLSITFNLSNNYFHGPLPFDVGNLEHLGSLDLSNNRLSGKIPASLGSCSSLENLFLQNNLFQGLIPSSLSSLKGILNIDFSQNNLSGQIPRFFEQLSVKYLNLSFNDLEGEVPSTGVFSNISGVSVAGNSKLCGDVTQSSSVGLKGMIGYAAPEYVLGSITLLDHVKDVVSLSMFYDDSQNRIVTTKNSGSDSDSDTSLSENLTRECLVSALKVGIACSAESPQARMSITDVVVKLKSILDIINSLEMQSGDAKSCGI
ncbi:hypothetical protein POM88_040524 [Heracleum sosnowskyi]|uniref:non-specific serine/threonine protein kinase n=1 Tax=Heracleum sosnowskyi TaxID=360622 RepID=A0AAD8HF10_9APIA|nr:hypothetical protein POM88_040524 [Heracleum sosnowskyi]